MVPLPPNLLEGSNGAIVFAVTVVICVQLACLAASLRHVGSLPSLYRQMKPVIALTVMAAGFQVRALPIWWFRFAEHHGVRAPLAEAAAAALHVGGTAAALVGLLCWLRVTMPKFIGPRAWAWVTVCTGAAFASPWLADGGASAWAWLLDALPRFRIF